MSYNARLVSFLVEDDALPEPLGIGLTSVMRRMKVGQSINIGEVNRNSAYNAAERLGIKITVRTKNGKRRIWRVK